MELTLEIFFIVCPLVFLAGVVDTIGGGRVQYAGGYIGAGLALKNGAKLARYCILFVLFLLALKVLGIY